jgi:hypothetical protein
MRQRADEDDRSAAIILFQYVDRLSASNVSARHHAQHRARGSSAASICAAQELTRDRGRRISRPTLHEHVDLLTRVDAIECRAGCKFWLETSNCSLRREIRLLL